MAAELVVVLEHLRIHEVAEQIIIGDLAADLVLHLLARALEVQRLKIGTGPALERLLLAEYDLLHLARPTAYGFTEATFHHVDDRLRERRGPGLEVHHIHRLNAAGHEEHRHVANHFAGGGHLHDVAKEIIDFGVGAGHFLPSRTEPHTLGLLAQIGVLSTGHFMLVNITNPTARAGIKRRIHTAHGFPIIGEFVQCTEIQTGLARRMIQRGHHAVEIRLTGGAGQRRNG